MNPSPAPTEDAEALERDAYNAAFYELGLPWHLDETTWRALRRADDASSAARVLRYVQAHHPHMLSAYDPQSLEQLIRARLRGTPAQARRCDWAQLAGHQPGI